MIRLKASLIVILLAGFCVGVLVLAARSIGKDAPPAPDREKAADAGRAKALAADIDKLRPLHKTLGTPKPGEWLHRHKEPGQTFAEYLRFSPVRPVGKRRVIYIQPLGTFSKGQRRIVTLTAAFMQRFFNIPVKMKKDLPLSLIPSTARRTHPSWGDKQILSTYVLDDVLRPRLPDDAAAYLAFTASDLWPGRGWNFVFGQASIRNRVGVWSIYRNGNPAAGDAAFRLALLRTMKTATHETGHMFSMLHCTKYACGMCGSNSRVESDARGILLGPECVAKLCWATRTDLVPRYQQLHAFCRVNGLNPETAAYAAHLKALGGRPLPTTRSAPVVPPR